MDYRKFLLNTLLDKYENSTHFFGNSQINRRVSLSFSYKTMPVYFAGDRPQDKNAIHQALAELQTANVVAVEWVRGEKGNLIKRISLNLEYIQNAYDLANRTPKADQLTELAELLRETSLQTSWLKEAVEAALNIIHNQKTVPNPFPENKADLQTFLRTLAGMDQKGQEEIPERIFSIRYLGNSKLFSGKNRAGLISLARSVRYSDPDFSDEDILAELGIVRTSAELLLAGPIAIATAGQTADLAYLPFGAVIDTHQAARSTIKALNTDTVLLVENKTNFHELIRLGLTKRLLLIYVGGFPGPAKRQFLATLGTFAANKNIYHWGDIDYGGFRIFRILQETAFQTLKPLFMDENTLLKYRHMSEPLKPTYRNKLARLIKDQRYSQFHPVINQMLELNLRLEQEALLADSDFCINWETDLRTRNLQG